MAMSIAMPSHCALGFNDHGWWSAATQSLQFKEPTVVSSERSIWTALYLSLAMTYKRCFRIQLVPFICATPFLTYGAGLHCCLNFLPMPGQKRRSLVRFLLFSIPRFPAARDCQPSNLQTRCLQFLRFHLMDAGRQMFLLSGQRASVAFLKVMSCGGRLPLLLWSLSVTHRLLLRTNATGPPYLCAERFCGIWLTNRKVWQSFVSLFQGGGRCGY